jgi:hypothetical protein
LPLGLKSFGPVSFRRTLRGGLFVEETGAKGYKTLKPGEHLFDLYVHHVFSTFSNAMNNFAQVKGVFMLHAERHAGRDQLLALQANVATLDLDDRAGDIDLGTLSRRRRKVNSGF